jgi:hypothetical protein
VFTTAAGWGAAARSPDSDGSSQELIYFVLVIAPPAAAVLINWDGNESVDGSFDGEFDVANNWNPDQVPAAGHMANFNADATYTVTFGSDEAADDMRVIDGVVTFLSDSSAVRTFDLISGAMDANVSGGQLYIGSEDNPVVVNVGDIMNIGSNAPGTSIVEVGGTMSALNAGSAIHHVGRNGNHGF